MYYIKSYGLHIHGIPKYSITLKVIRETEKTVKAVFYRIYIRTILGLLIKGRLTDFPVQTCQK